MSGVVVADRVVGPLLVWTLAVTGRPRLGLLRQSPRWRVVGVCLPLPRRRLLCVMPRRWAGERA